MPAGRPSKYKPDFPEQAEKLCRLGATDIELADFFKVNESTIYAWCLKYPEFSKALKAGKTVCDDRVERSLYRRATGYSYDAVKIFMPGGAKEPVYAEYREHVPPDTTSMIFWLKNRRREEWRDRHDHNHTREPVADTLSDEELERIASGRGKGASDTSEGPGASDPIH